MAMLQESRQELGGVSSCGTRVILVSKAWYGTLLSNTTVLQSLSLGPSPGPLTHSTPFLIDHSLHYYLTLRFGLQLYLYVPHHTTHP